MTKRRFCHSERGPSRVEESLSDRQPRPTGQRFPRSGIFDLARLGVAASAKPGQLITSPPRNDTFWPMRISIKQLVGLPVVTESGTQLGVVRDVELDVESHAVRQYVVGDRFFAKHNKLISPAHVIGITLEKMVVVDACGRAVENTAAASVVAQPSLSGVMTRSEK